ncbi:symmetrical bis(5'-nucleosyl)-tetraphosphatase [Neptunicella sp. SCSIO 80796]|uniref:symmetrical bis(5'-nucleosyl)-tetraphosphatase n=1 Tax=Neptunicella plasticusilytica TaxID=3117012 RepID=UPI003A4DE80D
MANFIVGDIQACYTPLKKLLDKAGFNPQQDKLWAVGDLIGRGPEALQTMQYLMSLGEHFDCVLGNHDLHFLAVSQQIKNNKAEYRFDPLLNSAELPDIVSWLRSKPLACKICKGHLITHAGLYPGWTIRQAVKFSDEVSQQLQSSQWIKLLSSMYANTPLQWSDKLSGIERYRFIINAMTRMRFVTSKNELNFSVKASLQDAPKNLLPWFQHPAQKLKSHQKILFGHWAALGGTTDSSQYIALDTGCVWGNKLTLLNLESGGVFSVSA